ncbi:MAG TPA: glycosyltransferase [Isosphaeraceae bacterium]|nr:glycosyltransferase [Isosphaeraceae bacterium]
MRQILFATFPCYLDDSNGAAVASRSMMELLARLGFGVEAVTGFSLELDQEVDPWVWLSARGDDFEALGGESWSIDVKGLRASVPPHFRLKVQGVPVTVVLGQSSRRAIANHEESESFLQLYDDTLDRFRPEVVVTFGGDPLAEEIRLRARARQIAVVFALHNFSYLSREPFETADAVIVPSRLASEFYQRKLGLDCTVLPNLCDPQRVRAEERDPRYVTFVTPSPEKGVFAFARIADELGRLRPDIPFLVVEGRGSERTLADCGLDLCAHGNVFLMPNTSDPRRFWRLTRICLMPSLWWENQPLTAIEAMTNGIPVIGSDRGGIPETLGSAGIVLPLPNRLTPQTREPPSPEEVSAWVESIVRLWDDSEEQARQNRISLLEAHRWTPEAVGPLYLEFFRNVKTHAGFRGDDVGEGFEPRVQR